MPYIGVSPQFGVRRKHTYTATAGQTSFSGAGSEGATLSYKDSTFVDVYQNGIKLGDADYTSTSGTAIVLVQGASVDDLVEIIVFDVFSAADTVSKADGGTFDGNIAMGGTLNVSGVLTANAGIKVDDITIDGTEVDLSSGSFTIDSAANITLDCGTGEFLFNNAGNGNLLKIQGDSSNVNFISMVQDKDIRFKGDDGGSAITALTLDMSASGDALFNRNIDIPNDSGRVRLGTGTDLQIYHDGSNNYFSGSGDHNFLFLTNGGEKLRIRNTGCLRASNNLNVSSHSRLSSTNAHVFHSHSSGNIMFFLENTSDDPRGMMFDYSQAAPDNNTNFFIKCEDSSAERAHIYSDGDMRNHDGTFSQASDERIKQNVTDANSQWDDIKAIRFINYKAKDDVRQYGEDKAKTQLGVLAQEMEKISPKLIKQYPPSKADVASSSEFGTLYEKGDTIPDDKVIGDVKEVKENVKGIAYSVLYMKAVKALQEAMTRIEILEAEVKALKGK